MNPFTYLWNLLFSRFPTQTPPLTKRTRKPRHIVPTTLSCHKWKSAHDEILMNMWEDGVSVEWLANYLHRSTAAIKPRLIYHGYSTKKGASRLREF